MLSILFGLKGRIGRRNYWFALLLQWVLLTVMILAFGTALVGMIGVIGLDVMPASMQEHAGSYAGAGMGIATFLLLVGILVLSVYMSIAAQVKRLHDMNMSGWLVAVNFVAMPISLALTASSPSNGPIALFVMLVPFGLGLACGFFPGSRGTNKYGADRITIFDGGSAKKEEGWAERAAAHREALRAEQEDNRAPAATEKAPRQRRAEARAEQRAAAPSGPRKGFGKRGMA